MLFRFKVIITNKKFFDTSGSYKAMFNSENPVSDQKVQRIKNRLNPAITQGSAILS
jgi:hypothetical protein